MPKSAGTRSLLCTSLELMALNHCVTTFFKAGHGFLLGALMLSTQLVSNESSSLYHLALYGCSSQEKLVALTRLAISCQLVC